MKNVMSWDEYEIKARYIPTFLSVIPLVHFLLIFFGEAFWKELFDSIDWMLVIADVSISLVVMLALVQIQCSFAKHYIEETIFGKGGDRFPTTNMLLLSEGLISIQRKEQIRKKITKTLRCKFSSVNEENNNPVNARFQAREAVGQVRITVGKGIMTIHYNIRYGFFRNLIAGIIWSATGSIGCSIIYAIRSNWKAMIFFVIYFMFWIVLFSFRKAILEKLAYNYADTLFNEFLSLS